MIDIDQEIQSYISLKEPKSFFLFAGAGSGKTRSLVNALVFIKEKYGEILRINGQHVAVITYTNAACDEIIRRLEFDPLFEVSTIHSFSWSIIKQFHADIKKWLVKELNTDIEELQIAQQKGRGGKAALDREAKIQSKRKRLEYLPRVKAFAYNPVGENSGRDSLTHSEVLKIAIHFLATSNLMKDLLIGKYPFFFIDESQDTNKGLMDVLMEIELLKKGGFVLGLFGDLMQRIYADGKVDLGQNLPDHWARPAKTINFRCPTRVTTLLNLIRSEADKQIQAWPDNQIEGFARLFLISSGYKTKDLIEGEVRSSMAKTCEDVEWNDVAKVKSLILEHKMAAKRLGFDTMFECLQPIERFYTSLLDGSLSVVSIFSNLILPTVIAKEKGNNFEIAKILRKFSPLMSEEKLRATDEEDNNPVKTASLAINKVYEVWQRPNVTFFEILKVVHETGLFEVPPSLQPFCVDPHDTIADDVLTKVDPVQQDTRDDLEEYLAIETFLKTKAEQIISYKNYVTDQSSFDTHQGIKGRQFERVMVLIDDSEAKGFLFKYDKLFGVEGKSQRDLDNEKEGKDTSQSRTRRLFYVTCSRAEKSLAVVIYTNEPATIRQFVMDKGWFDKDEIEVWPKR